jgi:CHAT domain-containing protein/Flp pilus assembly protein TadD
MRKQSYVMTLVVCFGLTAYAQTTTEVRPLAPSHPVEREIAGGATHTYQMQLVAGQFVHFRLEQCAIDSALVLKAPDGKQLFEMDLTGSGEEEPLSLEVKAPGMHQLTVRGNGATTLSGSYLLKATIQATPTSEDRKHLTAQTLLLEAQELAKGAANTAPQTIEKLEQALPIWRELGKPDWSALTLNKIGKAQFSLKKYDQAITSFEQAAKIHHELKNRFGEATDLNNLANTYFDQRQFDKAVELFEKSLALCREGKDRRREGLTLFNLGNTLSNLNQPEKAIEFYEQALAILREVKDQSNEGQVLMNIGRVYLNRGQSDKAIEFTDSSVRIFREAKDRSGEGLALNNLGIIYSRLGQSEKALESLNLALKLARELKQRSEEGNLLVTLGTVYGGMGETEKAIAYFEQALASGREQKDLRRQSGALVNLGLAYSFLGQYVKSIEHLEQALPIAREIKNRMQEGASYSYLGVSYNGLSRFEKAIESHEQALAIFREIKYRLGEGNTLQNLGAIYKFLGRDDKAIEYYEQALAIFRETKYRVGEGNALNDLGNSYSRLSRHEDAIKSYEQALAIHRELKYRLGEGTSLTEQGVEYARLNQHEKAMALYEQSLAIFREVKSRKDEGLTLFRAGESQRQMGHIEKATALFTESLNVNRAIGNRGSEIEPLTALAKIEGARGNLAQARTFIENSIQIAESLRSDLVSRESRTALLAAVQGSYQYYTELLMRQHQAEPTKGLAALAVEVSERQRARSLLDLLTEARADVSEGVDAALVERERLLGRQLNDKAERLTQTIKSEQAAALQLEISQLENDYERAQADIRKASPHYAALVQPQPLKLKEIQAQLDADTLLLEYALGEDRSYLWAISRDSLMSYELPKEEQIKQSALQVYELLTARSTNKRGESAVQRQERIAQAEAKLAPAAKQLSQTLLGPVAQQLGNKRLVIVADGALQYIPFAMLPEPSFVSRQLSVAKNNGRRNTDHGQPLIVNHEVISLPSASALAIQRTELAGRQLAPKMLAVIADPVFDRTDERFKTLAQETSDKAELQTTAFNDSRSIEHLAEKSDDKSSVTTLRLVIPRLPFTRQEATQLLALTPESSSFGAIDFEASRATVLKGDLSQYRYVHFATHGLLDTERPGLSSLVLSMVDAQGKPQDGFLRANDIYNLKLPAELVVLSACQTGLGKEIKGEGLVGLTRGFMYAGAARVVVSLWNVNDKATADLMTKFYGKMLKQGDRPAAALRAAQVEMWKQKQWRSPYYWAAFTMQGEWR